MTIDEMIKQLRLIKAEEGVSFKDMAAAAGVKESQLYDFMRPAKKEVQEKLEAYIVSMKGDEQ